MGVEVCIYCNTNYARNVLDNRLRKYSLWVAHYGVDKPGENHTWYKWVGFQYSENGTLNVN
ncbi:TPA: GH25 family lysozyme [Clostridium perfringens]|uniref:GH25 family lysozyme n=1 Tax=Clostridium perfringens TaxID=1502 RepID=UPI0035D45FCF